VLVKKVKESMTFHTKASCEFPAILNHNIIASKAADNAAAE
jgi:hypothetical protein